jgi:hypothetical protein
MIIIQFKTSAFYIRSSGNEIIYFNPNYGRYAVVFLFSCCLQEEFFLGNYNYYSGCFSYRCSRF